jgi:hypothetical protein
MYSSETEEAIILLLTVYDPKDNTTEVLHLADNFTQRLDNYTTDTDVVYGVTVSANNTLGTVDVQSSDYNGTQNPIDSYFKINGVTVNYTFTRGHTVMVVNPVTFAVESINTYDTYIAGNSQSLKTALQAIPAGKLVCVGSWDATSLDQSTRDYINQQFYTTKINTWTSSRTTHTLIGVKGNRYVTPIELVTLGSPGSLSHFVLNSTPNNSTNITSTSTSPGHTVIWSTTDLLITDPNLFNSTDPTYTSFLNNYGIWVKPPPAAGTLLSTYCLGVNKYGTYADGSGGTYTALIENKSVDCGYVRLDTYILTPYATNVNEGTTLSFTVTTTNVGNGTTLYWKIQFITGEAIAADFDPPGTGQPTTIGAFTITNNIGRFKIAAKADATTEGPQKFIVQILVGGPSGEVVDSATITINDTSASPGTLYAGMGSIISQGCDGLFYKTVYADGMGGTYTSLDNPNNVDCGGGS